MIKTEKEIVETFWKTWEAGAEVSRYDVPNKEFVEEAIIFGIKAGKELGKKNALSEIQELHDNMIEETAKAKAEGRKQRAEEIIEYIKKEKYSNEETLFKKGFNIALDNLQTENLQKEAKK